MSVRDERQRTGLRIAACLSIALGGMAAHSGTADDVYRFIDERGIPHFSNVPVDSRYRLFLHSAATLGFDSTAHPPAAILFAQPIVERGHEFTASVMFSSPERVHGWLEIGFDPAALTLRAVGMTYETPQPGRVRLLLTREQAAFSVDLHFEVNVQAPAHTSIELVQASMTTVNDRNVLPIVADVIPIAISSLVR